MSGGQAILYSYVATENDHTVCEGVSVGPSVHRSVRRSCWYKNELNQHEKTVSALEAISNVTAPAQKHATDDAVYTALFPNIFGLG